MNIGLLSLFDQDIIPWPTYHEEWALCVLVNQERRLWVENALIFAVAKAQGHEFRDIYDLQETLNILGEKITAILDYLPTLKPNQARALKLVDNPVSMRLGCFGGEFFLFLPKPEFEIGQPPPEFPGEIQS